jgi:hypothetical protein
MNLLFLDDNEDRTWEFRKNHRADTITCVTTVAECIRALTNGTKWDEVHLDHDLQNRVYVDPSDPESGSEVVRFIIANQDKIPQNIRFTIHSWNSNAAVPHMVKPLRKTGYIATYQPFGRGYLIERDKTIDAICDPDNVDLDIDKIYIIGEKKG